MSRRLLTTALSVGLLLAIGLYAYRWFTPDSPADLARVGQCEPYRAALARLDAGLDSEIAADPREIEMVVDECDRQGH